ncbi:prolyl oligopeptidase-like protein [Aureococcus anophagefferens]|nr:prolyl oligopeptidase-like protein [Aureococcus anophagefferens]
MMRSALLVGALSLASGLVPAPAPRCPRLQPLAGAKSDLAIGQTMDAFAARQMETLDTDRPIFSSGDTVNVACEITEGNTKRIQNFAARRHQAVRGGSRDLHDRAPAAADPGRPARLRPRASSAPGCLYGFNAPGAVRLYEGFVLGEILGYGVAPFLAFLDARAAAAARGFREHLGANRTSSSTRRAARRVVVAVVHGGFWKNKYTVACAAHETLAPHLAARGYGVVEVEYRRRDCAGGGWPGTVDDVAAALDAAGRWLDAAPASLPPPLGGRPRRSSAPRAARPELRREVREVEGQRRRRASTGPARSGAPPAGKDRDSTKTAPGGAAASARRSGPSPPPPPASAATAASWAYESQRDARA